MEEQEYQEQLQAAEADIRAHHNHIAVSKVQHFGNAVHHGVAQRNERVNAAQAETAD